METIVHKATRTLVEVGEALGIRNLDPEAGKIFVTGGTGPIGHRVAMRLLNAGYPTVRLGTSDPEKLMQENRLGAEIAVFSWDREDTYKSALAGVTSVLCTIPYTRLWYVHFPAFLDACKDAGVKHIIKISFYHARVPDDPVQDIPLVREHGECDQQLINMVLPDIDIVPAMGGDLTDYGMLRPNISYTILYASHFMSNPFTFQGHELRRTDMKPNTFYGASGNHGVNYVSPNDVAECAVRVLMNPKDHYNKEYTLTGPVAIKDQEVADLLSKHLNKPIMYVDQPTHELGDEMKMGGEPKWRVYDLLAIEKLKASSIEEAEKFVTKDIEKICGRPAETFEDYLQGTNMMTQIERGAPGPLEPLKGTICA